MQIQNTPLDNLTPYVRNPRNNEGAVDAVAASIKEFGFKQPIVVDDENVIIVGHTRYLAARKLGIEEVPVLVAKDLSAAQVKAYRIADNKTNEFSEWDDELLSIELGELQNISFDMSAVGFSAEELAMLDQIDEELSTRLENSDEAARRREAEVSLQERFLVPPFSILDAKLGYWQERKRYWCGLGIQSELGRGKHQENAENNNFAKCMPDSMGESYGRKEASATSIFDPVLCEVLYSWFCPKEGAVIDPFAGGSVRGIVASKLARKYTGVELSAEQVKANRLQADGICDGIKPTWHIGDSRNIDAIVDEKADFFFSCPPYADLEVYSDDPQDLSTLGYAEFKKSYTTIIEKTASLLNDNRFACFVVGEVRDKKSGVYQNFVSDTIEAFRKAGLDYYNEIILLTPLGTVPIRSGKQFTKSRKVGKAHQNVLVFVKGNVSKAVEACGDIEILEQEPEA